MSTGFVLDALEQALHDRGPVQKSGLVHHSDRRTRRKSWTARLTKSTGPTNLCRTLPNALGTLTLYLELSLRYLCMCRRFAHSGDFRGPRATNRGGILR